MEKKIIKDLSNIGWYVWRDDKTLVKFLKENNKKMTPTELCEEVIEKFNINTSLGELGAVKQRHKITHPTRGKPPNNWKNGMDIDKAFEGEDTL